MRQPTAASGRVAITMLSSLPEPSTTKSSSERRWVPPPGRFWSWPPRLGPPHPFGRKRQMQASQRRLDRRQHCQWQSAGQKDTVFQAITSLFGEIIRSLCQIKENIRRRPSKSVRPVLGSNSAPIPQPARKGAHFDTGDNAHGRKHGDDGGAAIADERQGQPHNGEHIETHPTLTPTWTNSIPAYPMAIRADWGSRPAAPPRCSGRMIAARIEQQNKAAGSGRTPLRRPQRSHRCHGRAGQTSERLWV